MKKTLVSALTTALVVGAASTTFAASNPFSDVPADHWAYDAVAQLAADGVIEGYGDGTYRGDQEITRYEMAQMIARAMAKGGGDKALIDKLAAEFADELNNLGVRVAALEKKVDNVKWTGMIRYRYITRSEENVADRDNGGIGNKPNTNGLLLRLEPTMQINKNWTGKARIDYDRPTEMDDAVNHNGTSVDRIWVEGKYSNVAIRLGKFNVQTAADYATTMDYRIAGGEAVFGKDIKLAARAGRLNFQNSNAFAHGGTYNGPGQDRNGNGYGSYVGVEVFGDRAKKFTWGLGWQQVRSDQNNEFANQDANNLNIWNLGLGYKFDKNVRLTGVYAWATGVGDNAGIQTAGMGEACNGDADKFKSTYAFQVNYKGADKTKKGSWGAFLAWRHLGDWATIHPTARENGPMNGGEQGWEVGVHYTFLQNILGKVQYYSGREIASGNNVSAVWTELGFYF